MKLLAALFRESRNRSSRPVVLISTQRSGTNLLRSLLRGSGKFADYDEILKLESDDTRPGFEYFDWDKYSYLRYRASRIAKAPGLSIPTKKNVQSLFNDYFAYLAKIDATKPYFVVDLKYNSIHHLNKVWQFPCAARNLFDLLAQSGFHIIHLVRENLFELYLSLVVAQQSKIYVARKGQSVEPATVHLEPEKMLYKMEQMELDRDYVRKCLMSVPRSIEFSYETLLGTDQFLSKTVAARLNEFLSDNLSFDRGSEYKKIVKDKWAVVENVEEVKHALRDSKYHRFITLDGS